MGMNTGSLGYEGKHSEPHDPCKKFQVFPVFDAKEANEMVKGIKDNISTSNELLPLHHGAKEAPGEMNLYVLDKKEAALRWIYSRIAPALKAANQVWSFEIHNTENFHLIEFGVTNNTEWHLDGFSKKTLRRKVSFSLMLSDPEDYRGGNLELWYDSQRLSAPSVRKGEMVIYPSFILNRIESVKRGPRYALVGWGIGKQGLK